MPYAAGDSLGGLRADLGPLPLGAVDSSGVAWSLMKLDGWGSAAVRAEYQPREGDHGTWASPVYLGERPVTLAGTITAPDLAALDDAMERLRSAAALTDTPLVVHESIPKLVTVRRAGEPLLEYLTDQIASYSVLVTAADPRRYATVLQQGSTGLPVTTGGLTPPYAVPYTLAATTVAGQVDAYNEGSMDTRPTMTITGPVSRPTVFGQMPDGSVRMLMYGLDLADGDQLVIDTDAHTAILNGNVSRRRYLTTPQGWPTIPAGGAVSYQFRAAAYSPTALLTVRWRSAWM
ncbi:MULTISPECIES: phage distal tail protein [Streptomyces]|uniref:Phage tail protein n=2 Tax=Streptomyces rimosus subsp. rimosus TaxID=132474 RepID=L8EL65_STRR1|nr:MULTISPECIES: phage tail domain-containing protein [Streptomyces]KOG84141.1 hypothetical protein ADK78_00630 [Kitasatospora aureofaciens]MYT41174.1 hypothetical protein [Streptomyces sp. SID5471]KUJ43422.1 hypothetical protein ADK46_00620 [Streptomyces rimosus subsp. rimosus]QDA07182.1 hypothetical protein CTZ40_28980 [Streptomyces rimosus]QEV78460.1 hypothetical protein CP984_28940 [Streptomyces rimosus]